MPKPEAEQGEGEEPEAASSEAPGNAAGVARDFRGRRRRRGRRGETGGRGPSPERGERPERGEVRRRKTRSETGSEPRSEPRNESRNEPRNDRFNRGDRAGRGGSESRFQRPAATTARIRSRLRLRPASGISTDRASRRIDLEVPATGSESSAGCAGRERTSAAAAERPASAAIVANFPEDEPIFAAEVSEPLHEQHEHVLNAEVEEEVHGDRFKRSASGGFRKSATKCNPRSELISRQRRRYARRRAKRASAAAPQVAREVAPRCSSRRCARRRGGTGDRGRRSRTHILRGRTRRRRRL